MRHRVGIGGLVVAFDAMQMDRRGGDFAARQSPQPGFAAFGQAGEAGAALAQRPFQQRIVAAADDRRRRRAGRARRHARRNPADPARLSGTASGRSTLLQGTAPWPPARRACARTAADSRRLRRWSGAQASAYSCTNMNTVQKLTSFALNATACGCPNAGNRALSGDATALELVLSADPRLMSIVCLSLFVSLSAVALRCSDRPAARRR